MKERLKAADIRTIFSHTPPSGFEFDKWTGDTEYLDDILNNPATVTMPANNVTLTATFKPIPIVGLRLLWDNITNAPVSNIHSVSDWNTYFDLPANGTPFTLVSVTDNEVILCGGSNIHLKDNLFMFVDYMNPESRNHVIEAEDMTGCVISIGALAFSEAAMSPISVLTTAIFPAVTSVGNHAFLSCFILENIDFYSLVDAGDNAFNACQLINSDFPELVTTGVSTFSYCLALTNPNFNKLETIGSHCFHTCTNLTSDFPSAKSIGEWAFGGCNSLTNQSFPNVLSIGLEAFFECQNYAVLDFPSCTTIGGFAFQYCPAITTINIPSVTDLGGSVGDDFVFIFYLESRTITLTIPEALMTCNDGSPDGDIQYLQANNTVTIITV